MAFVNEYVPPLELETSDFLRKARVKLQTGHSKWDMWTVDRDHSMVLVRRGGGHSMDSRNDDYWSFLNPGGLYFAITEKVETRALSADEISIVRSISFQTGNGVGMPDAEVINSVKAALREYKDYGVISDYKTCHLTLIDAVTGREV